MDLSDLTLFRRDPTPGDLLGLEAEISLNEQEIASINTHIDSVSKVLEQLRTKRNHHSVLVKRCRAVLTLARRLPPELLGKIFELASENWSHGPFVVSQVCSAWRRAAQAPRVWSHLHINCDLDNPVGRTWFLLQKAQQAPLYIKISGTRPQHSHVAQIVTMLLQRAPQWFSLFLDFKLLRDTNYFISQCTKTFPNLRSVFVNSEALFEQELDGGAGTFSSFQGAFLDAPNLMDMQLTSNIVPALVPSQLSSLTLSFIGNPSVRPLSAPSIVNLLQECYNLKYLKLEILPILGHPVLATENQTLSAELPQLRTFILDDISGLSWILPHIHAPSLTNLHLRSPEMEVPSLEVHDLSGPTLLNFLNVSRMVQVLELHHIDIWPEQLTSCFKSLPELRDLRLHDSDIDDGVFEGLLGPDGLCPVLSRIDLRWCHHIRGTTLVDLVRSRLENGSCTRIEEVAALHCSLVRKPDIMCLATLTTCRVVLRNEDDYCRKRLCCENVQYRNRLRFHCLTLPLEQRLATNIILDLR